MLKKQSGLTMITWMIVIGFIGIQAVMAMRIIPVYINFNAVKHVMDGLPSDPEVRTMSTTKMRKYLSKRLKIENLYDLSRNKEAFKFVKKKTGLALVLHYEDRGPILSNLEFVATFDHEVSFPGRR
jgi:microsomal dipeptidase-like Zn-dependent dipeptidase